MIVPIVIVAIGTYIVFVQWRLQGTLFGFVVAHACLGYPARGGERRRQPADDRPQP